MRRQYTTASPSRRPPRPADLSALRAEVAAYLGGHPWWASPLALAAVLLCACAGGFAGALVLVSRVHGPIWAAVWGAAACGAAAVWAVLRRRYPRMAAVTAVGVAAAAGLAMSGGLLLTIALVKGGVWLGAMASAPPAPASAPARRAASPLVPTGLVLRLGPERARRTDHVSAQPRAPPQDAEPRPQIAPGRMVYVDFLFARRVDVWAPHALANIHARDDGTADVVTAIRYVSGRADPPIILRMPHRHSKTCLSPIEQLVFYRLCDMAYRCGSPQVETSLRDLTATVVGSASPRTDQINRTDEALRLLASTTVLAGSDTYGLDAPYPLVVDFAESGKSARVRLPDVIFYHLVRDGGVVGLGDSALGAIGTRYGAALRVYAYICTRLRKHPQESVSAATLQQIIRPTHSWSKPSKFTEQVEKIVEVLRAADPRLASLRIENASIRSGGWKISWG